LALPAAIALAGAVFVAIDEDLVGLGVALRGSAALVVLANLFIRAGDGGSPR
jgi:hypothetical protein